MVATLVVVGDTTAMAQSVVKPLDDDAFMQALNHVLTTGLGPMKKVITVDVVSDPN